MVEISNCKDPCFAKMGERCKILTCICIGRCNFYKPVDCEDWIKAERGSEVWLIPPEEYYAELAEKK